MRDFWRSSGYHLLSRTAEGHLRVTDDFLRAYLMRPEIRPVEDSCAAERRLHASLMENPTARIPEERLAGLADPDARDNYRIVLDFRDRLLAAETVESFYLSLFRRGPVDIPPLFVDQLAHVILRNILENRPRNGLEARAGELFFRPQRASIEGGTIRLADDETVEALASHGAIDLDVLDAERADAYWLRDERHDTVLDISFSKPGLDALCRVIEAWVRHFLGVGVTVQPVQSIRDERWAWHIGLDAEATALLNDLYDGVEVGEQRLVRLLSLFRLDFNDPERMLAHLRGRPIYLALAVTPEHRLRLKPQNILVSLPLAPAA